MKIKISYRAAGILDGIFTGIFIILAFLADWRIGAAFIFYDLAKVCEEAREAFRRKRNGNGN
jgi:hypothetical protein